MSGRGAGPRKSVGPTIAGSGWDTGAANSDSWEKERDVTIPEPFDPWKKGAKKAQKIEAEVRKEEAWNEAMAHYQEEVRRMEEARRQEGAYNSVTDMAPSIQPVRPELVPSALPTPEGARGSFDPSLPPPELRTPLVPVVTTNISNHPPAPITVAPNTTPPSNFTAQAPTTALRSPSAPITAPAVSFKPGFWSNYHGTEYCSYSSSHYSEPSR